MYATRFPASHKNNSNIPILKSEGYMGVNNYNQFLKFTIFSEIGWGVGSKKRLLTVGPIYIPISFEDYIKKLL